MKIEGWGTDSLSSFDVEEPQKTNRTHVGTGRAKEWAS